MANAKLHKDEHFFFKDFLRRYEYAYTEQSDVDLPFFNCIDRDTSEPGVGIIRAATVGNGLFQATGTVFGFRSLGSYDFDYMALLGAQTGSGFGLDCILNVLRPKAVQNNANVQSWTEDSDHSITFSMSGDAGVNVGDWVSFRDDGSLLPLLISAGTSMSVSEDGNLNRVLVPVTTADFVDEFVVNSGMVSATGDSIGAIQSHEFLVYEIVNDYSFTIDGIPKDIFIDISVDDDDSYFIISHNGYSGSQDTFSFNRIMAGGLIQTESNIQPPIITPIKESERIEMENGSFRYEPASVKKQASISWLSMPISETMEVNDMIELNLRSRPIVFTAFPDHPDYEWRRRNTIIGVLDSAELTPFVEDGTKYFTSGSMVIIGTVFDEVH